MKLTSIMAVLALLTATAAAAQEAPADPPAQVEKKVCRSEKMTGSLTRVTRICMTPTQWRELNARTRKGVDEMAGSASGSQEVARNNPGM